MFTETLPDILHLEAVFSSFVRHLLSVFVCLEPSEIQRSNNDTQFLPSKCPRSLEKYNRREKGWIIKNKGAGPPAGAALLVCVAASEPQFPSRV